MPSSRYLYLRPSARELMNAEVVASPHAGIALRHIVVDQVEPFGWRVRDGRFPETDHSAVIGFVEEDDNLFEVVQLGGALTLLSFDTLDDALQHLARHAVTASPTTD